MVHPEFTVSHQSTVTDTKAACGRSSPVIGSPALDEAHADRAHPGELVHGLEALVDRLCQQSSKLLVVEDLQVTSWRQQTTGVTVNDTTLACTEGLKGPPRCWWTHLGGSCRRWQDASHSAGYSWGSARIWRYHWDTRQTLLLQCNTAALHGLEEDTITTSLGTDVTLTGA